MRLNRRKHRLDIWILLSVLMGLFLFLLFVTNFIMSAMMNRDIGKVVTEHIESNDNSMHTFKGEGDIYSRILLYSEILDQNKTVASREYRRDTSIDMEIESQLLIIHNKLNLLQNEGQLPQNVQDNIYTNPIILKETFYKENVFSQFECTIRSFYLQSDTQKIQVDIDADINFIYSISMQSTDAPESTSHKEYDSSKAATLFFDYQNMMNDDTSVEYNVANQDNNIAFKRTPINYTFTMNQITANGCMVKEVNENGTFQYRHEVSDDSIHYYVLIQ